MRWKEIVVRVHQSVPNYQFITHLLLISIGGVVLLKVVPVCVVSESGLALSAYGIMMNDYIEKGYAVKLSEKEVASTSDHTWYLPHHGVVNSNKSKVRVVCDAAAVWGGTSLNKEL